ncbi:hypothetical protein JW948_05045 [bacterium]|nr:hypothetical protein [bacterium]
MRNPFLRSLVAMGLVLTHLLIVSCDDKSTEPKEESPPVMPPQGSMMIDLSMFSAGGTQSLAKTGSPQTQLHFATAVVTLGLVNLGVIVHLALPAFIFGQALTVEPVLQRDGKFHWIYNSVYQLVQYQSDLAGWVDVPAVTANWEMFVTQANKNLDHFKWYKGSCDLSASTGDWTFYDYLQPDAQVPVIQIDWVIDSGSNDRLLVFENVFEGNANEGDMLSYEIEGDSARVSYFNASELSYSRIVWNLNTIAGYIQSPGYNNGQPAKWDENQNDI